MPLHRPHAFPQGFPVEGQLPAFPSPTYLVELGVTHLLGDKMLTGSRAVVGEVTHAISGDLRKPYDTWHMGGHLGEIGKTALEMEPGKGPSGAEEVQAVRRSAVMMATLGVANTVAGESREGRTASSSSAFLNGVSEALLLGNVPDAVDNGPRRGAQYDAFLTAARTHDFLKLDDGQKDALEQAFGSWATEWVELLSLSRPKTERDPEQLLQIAQTMGIRAMDMARIVVLEAGNGGHSALSALGAIGGLEAQGTYPFSAAHRSIHTYQTELIRRYGVERGLAKAAKMRIDTEAAQYDGMQQSLDSPRERRVARTVTWFTTKVGDMQRRRQKFDTPDVRARLALRVETMPQRY